MSADAYVQVAADGPGKKVATQEVTRADGLTVVEVQEVLGEAIVSNTPETYSVGNVVPLSVTTEGRLRVSAAEAVTFLDHFGPDADAMSALNGNKSLWGGPNPWGI